MNSQHQIYHFGRSIIQAYSRAFLDVQIRYTAPLPDGAFILAANHPTSVEPALLPLLMQRPMSIMISESVYKLPLLSNFLVAAGHIKVVQGAGIPTLSTALRRLEAGCPVAIFPEGGLSPLSGGFLKPHSGAVRLALAANVPIVPVGFAGDRTRIRSFEIKLGQSTETGHFYAGRAWTITVGAPYRVVGSVDDWREVECLSGQMMDEIKLLVGAGSTRLGTNAASPAPALKGRTADVEG